MRDGWNHTAFAVLEKYPRAGKQRAFNGSWRLVEVTPRFISFAGQPAGQRARPKRVSAAGFARSHVKYPCRGWDRHAYLVQDRVLYGELGELLYTRVTEYVVVVDAPEETRTLEHGDTYIENAVLPCQTLDDIHSWCSIQDSRFISDRCQEMPDGLKYLRFQIIHNSSE